MYFALFYLLFFVIDILLLSRCLYLGMISMNCLVGGVGVFFGFLMIRSLGAVPFLRRHRPLTIPFIAYILVITLFNLFEGSSRLLAVQQSFFMRLQYFFVWFFLCSGAALLLLSLVFLPTTGSPYTRWIRYASGAGAVRYLVILVAGWIWRHIPNLLYRYIGVFDVVMLFGWLRLIHLLLHEEVRVEESDDRRFAVY